MNTRIAPHRLVIPLFLTLAGMAAAQAPTLKQRVLLTQAELIATITTPDQAENVRAWLDDALVLVLAHEPEAAPRLAPAAHALVKKAEKSLASAKTMLPASVWRDLAGLLAIGSREAEEVISLRLRSLTANSTAAQQRLALRLLREVREGKPASPEPPPKTARLDTWQEQQDDLLAKVLEDPKTDVALRQRAFDHISGEFHRQAEVDGDAPERRFERLERFAAAAQQLLPELNQTSLVEEPGRATTPWPFTTLRVRLTDAAGGAQQTRPAEPNPAAPTAEIRRRKGNSWVPLTRWPVPAEPSPTAPDIGPGNVSLRMIAELDAIYWLRVTTHQGMVNVLLTWSADAGARRLGSGAIQVDLPAVVPAKEVLVAELRADGSCLLTRAACFPYSIPKLRSYCINDEKPNQALIASFGTVTEQSRDISHQTAELLDGWLTSPRSRYISLSLPTATVCTVLAACAGAEPFDLHLDDHQRILGRDTVDDATKRYILINATEEPQ